MPGFRNVLRTWSKLFARRLGKTVHPVYPPADSFILSPHEAARRVLALEGAANFRDIGGYQTSDGQTVRWGRVYRAGALSGLTEAGQRKLAELGVKLVCDFRSAQEVHEMPNHLADGIDYVHLPIHTEDARDTLRALLFDHQRLQVLLPQIYRYIIDHNAHAFGDLLRRLSDPDQLPAVVHCTAGKDRTGISIALLLLTLGVPEETVIQDYTLSNLYFQNFLDYARDAMRRVRFLGLSGDDLYPLLVAKADTLRGLLDYIRERYGSVEGYLRERAGVDDEVIARLRANLLE